MNELVFTEEDYFSLRARLHDSKFESCAVLKTNIVEKKEGKRLLVGEVLIAPPNAYRKRNTSSAVLEPAFLVPIVKSAASAAQGLAFVHTHPWETGTPLFSSIDDHGEELLKDFLRARGIQGPNIALLFGRDFCRARVLGTKNKVLVTTVGTSRRIVFGSDESKSATHRFDRQIRLLGIEGQRQLSNAHIGIVGVGGTGSIVAQELAYLGVKQFSLVDPDLVDESNLNRLVGARRTDVGKFKVSIAKRHILQINPTADVSIRKGSVLDADAARTLLGVDLIFCCTDSQASRAVLNQLAYQFYIPCIDIGVSITTGQERISRVTGRVQLLSPGHACLTCQELLDSKIIREEFMTPEQKAQDPYFIGNGEPQPAVISLNGTVSSLAVTMFLSVVAHLPSSSRQLIYDALQGRIRSATATPYPTCVVCSRQGALGRGGSWALPVRS